MRLLERRANGAYVLDEFASDHVPSYAILSHTWGSDNDELTVQDLTNGRVDLTAKAGYQKLRFCGDQAAKDGLE